MNEYAIEKFGFVKYRKEIEEYVLNGVLPHSKIISDIVNEFNYWVAKYGRQTY